MSQTAAVEEPPASASDPTELVASVAHEMRTPLTALVQALDILASGRSGTLSDPQRRFVEMGISNARSLLAMTGRLQEMARWDAGDAPVRFGLFDPAAAAREVAEAMAALAQSRGIGLDVEHDAGLRAWGDEELVREVIVNYVGNALKFTPPGGTVTIVAREADSAGWIELAVRDDGPGIPAGQEERIFGKFVQAGTPCRKREGLGLGLALARRIVQAHGGATWARNNADGGCTVSLRIPAFGSGHAAATQIRRLLKAAAAPVMLVALLARGRGAGELVGRLAPSVDAAVTILDLGHGRLGLAWEDGDGRSDGQPRLLDALCAAGCAELVAGWSAHRAGDGGEDALLAAARESLDAGLERIEVLVTA